MEDTRWLTIARLERRLGVEAVTLSDGDTARMEAALRAAQTELETSTGRRFVPVAKTVSHWARAGQVALPLRDDLLELASVADCGGEVYAPADLVWDSGTVTLNAPFMFAGGEVVVTGLWAHHPTPAQAFRAADELVEAVAAADSALTVVSADGPDLWGDTPRFAAGQLVRVGSELMRVTAVEGNTLAVRRGENGTESADHGAGAPVDVYVPGFTVEALGLRLAAWLYREPDGEHGREYPKGIERGILKLRRHSV